MLTIELNFILIAFSVSLFVIILYYDNNPQQYPIPDNSQVIDCYNIQLLKLSQDRNRLNFSFRAKKPFIEFPIEFSPHLIHINIISSSSSFDNFWDFSASYKQKHKSEFIISNSYDSNYFDFDFNILQSSSGNVTISTFCHNLLLHEFDNSQNSFDNL